MFTNPPSSVRQGLNGMVQLCFEYNQDSKNTIQQQAQHFSGELADKFNIKSEINNNNKHAQDDPKDNLFMIRVRANQYQQILDSVKKEQQEKFPEIDQTPVRELRN